MHPGHLHILGHPTLPLGRDYPEDSQLFNCWNFCLLAEEMGIPYSYYGVAGSVLPPEAELGQVVSIGKPTGKWQWQNRWHGTYTRRLSRALSEHCQEDGAPQWMISLYGVAQAEVEYPAAFPVVEAMVGYRDCWCHHRVFPSYAQQHALYAANPQVMADRFFDTVIPHFVDPRDYTLGRGEGGYLLYLGRDAVDKGIAIAQETADACGVPLRRIHHGCAGEEKRRVLGDALAVMMPTQYLEPFGYVAIEAFLSGTPVIASDWGSFPEMVENGVNGWRCRTAAELRFAVENAGRLNRPAIRQAALKRYTVQSVAPEYRRYLLAVWEMCRHGGYYAPEARRF